MKIKQIDGGEIELNLESEQAKAHFANPANYGQVIIDEFSHEPFKGYIKPNSVILDIGANIGLFALHVIPYARKIICVEPTPEHIEILQDLLTEQTPVIICEQSALNNFTGTALFRSDPVNTTMNALSDSPDSYEVDCITLADLCTKYDLNHVDVCKVDIEGGEFVALTVETIKPVSKVIDSFLIETHPASREAQDHFIMIFNECGYQAEYVGYNGGVYAYK